MAWLKRHLFLTIGGVVALLLIGTGTWYLMGSIAKNKEIEGQLEAQKSALSQLYQKEVFPHRTNIDAAKRETAKVRTAITQARQSFTPMPFKDVKDMAFKTLLDTTLDELHKKAEKSGVALPDKSYAFSFEAQKKALKFSPGSFPGIAIQLAEAKAICDILFDAKINRLAGLRRARLSPDDPPGSADYVEVPIATNDVTGAVLSPYQAEFHCFSSELAVALEGLYKSPNGLLVKALYVEPGPAPVIPPTPPAPVVAPPPQPAPGQRTTNAPGVRLPPRPAAVAPGLTNVLNERVLKVVMRVDVVKPPAGK
jgi:hypothetical protein